MGGGYARSGFVGNPLAASRRTVVGHERMTHQELLDLTASHAMGALEGEERSALESHLPACEACRRALGSYGDVTGFLAYATPRATPPNAVALRDRVLRDKLAPFRMPLAGSDFRHGLYRSSPRIEYRRYRRSRRR
jgi:hypothetical protein